MRLPMKPSHTPDTTAVFLIFLASAITVASTSLPVFAPRTTSSSFITLAGLKKCMPTTSCGRLVNAAIWSTSSVEVLRGQDRAGLHHLVERLEDLFLDAHVLEHGLDHQVGVLDVVVGQRGVRAAPCAASYLSGFSLPFLTCDFVVLADRGHAAVERLLLGLEHRHRDAGVEEVHRDAAAHRAGADDGHLLDRRAAACRRARRGSCWRRARRRRRGAAPCIRASSSASRKASRS